MKKIGEHAVAVFAREIGGVIGNVELLAHAAHHVVVFLRGADAVVALFFPVFHEDRHDVMPLLLQKRGGHGGIDAAGYADDDGLCHRKTSLKVGSDCGNVMPRLYWRRRPAFSSAPSD